MARMNGWWALGVACALSFSASVSSAENGTDPTRISLPKGPGSIEGLGRTFEPSPASGTASYGVDIATPLSIGGFAPKLSLDYDGGSGVSELGMGWRLGGIAAIKRRTADGLPRFDASDAFDLAGLAGGAELVEVAPGVFRSRFESGSFVRVLRSGERWEARAKDGTTYRFGGADFTEEEGGRVATYLLSEQLDRHGHAIRYEWDTSDGHALPLRIVWNDLAASVRAEVVFEYEARPDVHELFSAGIRQRIARRLTGIVVSYGGQQFRRYQIGYQPGSPSRMASVALTGADGVTSLPTLSFGYSEIALDPTVVTMQSPPGRAPNEADVALADLDGDSLPDLLVGTAGAYRSYLNHDGAVWQAGSDWATTASPSVSLGTTGVQLADLDADGAIDLVIKSGVTDFRYLPAVSAAGFGTAVPIATVPTFSFEDPDVRLADVDSDSRIDVMVTTPAGLAIAYNLGGRDFTEPTIVGQVDPLEPLQFSSGAELCDMNGDRIQDFCKLRSTSLVYWLGRGRGRFEAARIASGVPSFEVGSPYQIVDLDGDGWADLVRIGVTGVDFARAEGIGLFGDVRRIDGTPERRTTTAVEFADMNGSGTTDIVWVDVTASARWQYLELFPNGRGGLLTSIDNGLGKQTRMAYGTAAKHAARARAENRPWTSRLNAAMPVVERITVDALLGDPLQVVELDYRDGTWDPVERTFAGFASATQRDLGDEYTPTRIREFSFDVGLEHRAMRGKTLTSEDRDGPTGQALQRTINSYQLLEVARALDGTPCQYAYKSSEQVEHIEATTTPRIVLSEWQHDTHGNAVVESRWGEVVAGDKLAGADEAVTRRTFAENVEDWLLGYVASEELTDAAGKRIRLKRSYYDGEPFQGLPLGQVTRGDVTRIESWIEGERFADEQRTARDEHGNPTTVFDARGARVEFDYDPESRTFTVAERRFVSERRSIDWVVEYDRALGVVTEATGPNGERYSFRYDGLSRPTAIVQPGDTQEYPTREFSYELASPVSRIRSLQRERAGSSEAIEGFEFYDGLGRLRGKLEEGSSPGQWVAKEIVRFDARGSAAFTAHPSFESEPLLPNVAGRPGTLTRRDALARGISVEHPDGARTRTEWLPLGRQDHDENDLDPSSPHFDTPTRKLQDGLGRLVRVIERDGTREVTSGSYEYDAAGKLVRSTDAAGRVRSYELDGRGRQRLVVDPNAGSWQLSYTDGNDLEMRTDPLGNRVRFVHDALGRVVEEWHRLGSDGQERRVVQRLYDEPSAEHPTAANLVGQLARVEDEAGSMVFGYSPRGLEIEKIRRWSDGKQHRLSARYDSSDRRVARAYPDGTELEQRYDSRGLLKALGPIVTNVEWTPWGRPAKIELGNGVVDTHHHDERMRLTRLEARNPTGSVLRDLVYQLDASSRISGIQDLREAVSPADSATRSFTYDDRYRLRTASDGVGRTEWQLDDVGNILEVRSEHQDAHLNVINRFGEDAAGPDRLTHHGDEAIAYDAAGRVVSDGERTLEWDAKGRLSRVRRGNVVEEYAYDHEDVRTLKRTTVDGKVSETRYISNDAEVRDGRLVRYVWLDGRRVARLDAVAGAAGSLATPLKQTSPPSIPGLPILLCAGCGVLLLWHGTRGTQQRWKLAFVALAVAACGDDSTESKPKPTLSAFPKAAVVYLGDLQGSVLAVADAQGKITSTRAYHPYGAVRSTAGGEEPFEFVGNEFDEGSGLSDFKARPYRSELGAFLAPDPVALLAAQQVLERPAMLAPYLYAAADPINSVDPHGLWSFPVTPIPPLKINLGPIAELKINVNLQKMEASLELRAGLWKKAQDPVTQSGVYASGGVTAGVYQKITVGRTSASFETGFDAVVKANLGVGDADPKGKHAQVGGELGGALKGKYTVDWSDDKKVRLSIQGGFEPIGKGTIDVQVSSTVNTKQSYDLPDAVKQLGQTAPAHFDFETTQAAPAQTPASGP